MNEQKLAQLCALGKVNEQKLADAQDKNLLAAKKAVLQYSALDYGRFKRLIKYNVEASDVCNPKNIYLIDDIRDIAKFHGTDKKKIQEFYLGDACTNLRENNQRKLTPPVLEKIAKDFSATHDKQN